MVLLPVLAGKQPGFLLEAASYEDQLTEQVFSPTPSVGGADELNSGLIVALPAASPQAHAQTRWSVVT